MLTALKSFSEDPRGAVFVFLVISLIVCLGGK
jgi:hypothetical protein